MGVPSVVEDRWFLPFFQFQMPNLSRTRCMSPISRPSFTQSGRFCGLMESVRERCALPCSSGLVRIHKLRNVHASLLSPVLAKTLSEKNKNVPFAKMQGAVGFAFPDEGGRCSGRVHF